MRKSVALLAMAALFFSGVLVGVLSTHAFYAYQIHQPGGLAAIGMRLLGNSLDHQLDLSAEQKRQVDVILADTRLELQGVRHDTVPRLFAIRDRAFDRVNALLTPAQQQQLRRFRSRHQERVERLVGAW